MTETAVIELTGKITEIPDGDTVRMVVEIPVDVRLKDCWCAETDDQDPDEKAKGLAAKAHMRSLALHERATLRMEYKPGKGLQQLFTFGRVLGHLRLADGSDLSAAMRAAGHATKTKPRKAKK